MKKIQAHEVEAASKCNLVISNSTCELRMASKNQYILDWSENFTAQTIRESINFTSEIKFRHWMRKLQQFKLDF